ncbi:MULTISPECIES: hypothetical protein [unclassified Rhizobium]|uniref:hypothetical protein n=1 Tax=unclassified Rhizobium TaxID=2613769 RepID=UPI001FF007F6|nr:MULTISPECIES: hypothetical protein [unclassified Rhizobium]
MVYAGLTMESEISATYMRALPDGAGTAFELWAIGLCKPDLKVYKPPQSKIRASQGWV